MEMQTLEEWLWDAACAIRGPVGAPKFKDYILPLIFLKRLSDVFQEKLEHLVQEFGSEEGLSAIITKEEAARND